MSEEIVVILLGLGMRYNKIANITHRVIIKDPAFLKEVNKLMAKYLSQGEIDRVIHAAAENKETFFEKDEDLTWYREKK